MGPTTPPPPSRTRSKFSSASHLASFDKAVCDETRALRDGERRRLEVDAIDNMRRKRMGKSGGFFGLLAPPLFFWIRATFTPNAALRIKRRRLMFVCRCVRNWGRFCSPTEAAVRVLCGRVEVAKRGGLSLFERRPSLIVHRRAFRDSASPPRVHLAPQGSRFLEKRVPP